MATYAMECGKHVAIEVPAAMTLDEIWKVIDTAERTRKHCMMLENCVYDFFEITTLNMAQQGLFGNITHVKGAYNSGVTITKRREGRANKYEAIYNTNNELIYKKESGLPKAGIF